jgi:tRNA threonylcarbamoyladenosine biosynthesis protein TsaB
MAGVWGIFEAGTVGSGSGLARGAALAAAGTVEYKLPVRILAVDTTTARGSLALVTDQGVAAESRSTTQEGHSRWLLAAVARTLEELGLEARDLDGFAVTVGPGSFTGLRVGMSSVQGLALGAGAPCVGVSSLDLLGLAGAGGAPTVLALVDAQRGEVFGGVYDSGGRPAGEPRMGTVESLVEELHDGAAFVGDGALRYRAEIEALVRGARFPEVDLFLAASLGRVALEALRAGRGCAPGELRPLYLRAPHIRKPRG